MSLIWVFNGIENKYDVYRSEDSMKRFRESLKELAMRIVSFKTKKIMLLTSSNRMLLKNLSHLQKTVWKKYAGEKK